MPTINTCEEAIGLLEQVVAEFGEDYVYEYPDPLHPVRCYYVWNGQCSCLIGHALHRAGWSIEQLAPLDRGTPGVAGPALITSAAELGLISELELSAEAARTFGVAQGLQDDGSSWGVALADARKTCEFIATTRAR